MTNGKEVAVTETARNEYNVDMPAKAPEGPFVIKLQIEENVSSADKYRDALTWFLFNLIMLWKGFLFLFISSW